MCVCGGGGGVICMVSDLQGKIYFKKQVYLLFITYKIKLVNPFDF